MGQRELDEMAEDIKNSHGLDSHDYVKMCPREVFLEDRSINQEIKQTIGKAPLANLREFHLAFEEVSRVRQYGKVKYPNANSWREVPDEELDNAIFRHFFNPNKIDKESGFSHKAHMITNLLFELQKEMELKQCD